VHAADRPAAVDRLADALERFEVGGIATNIPYLRALVRHADFAADRVHTRWLESLDPAAVAA
jgi:acetyl-CoA carboxylase biotin carboxylase subunit